MSDEAPLSTTRRRLVAVGIGLALVAVVALNVFVVPRVFGDPDGSQPAAASAAAAVTDLPTVTAELAAAPAVRYTGTFLAAGQNATYQLDARATAGGTLLGTIQTAGTIGEVLEIGDRTFVRAAEGFWTGSGVTDERRDAFADRWVLVPPAFLGVDLTDTFGPAALAAGGATPVAGGRATVDSVAVQQVTAGERTFSLSVATPRRLVGVSATGYQLTPVLLDEAGRASFFTQLRKAAGELATAADLGSRITAKTRTVLQNCGFAECTVKIGFVNRIAPTAKYATTGATTASVTITVTRKGEPVETCELPLSLAPGASKVVNCVAETTTQTAGKWRATHAGADGALAAAEAKQIVAALETELATY